MADQNMTINACGTTISSAKQEFESRIAFLEPNIAKALKSGSVHSVDFDIYATRHLKSDTTVELMQSSDSKTVGLTNINDRKLEANTYAFITGISILQATVPVAAADKADVQGVADYTNISAALAGGEFELRNGDKILIPRTSLQRFRTKGANEEIGYMKLECPKFIAPMTDIVPQIWLPKAVENVAVRIVLHGVKTNKA